MTVYHATAVQVAYCSQLLAVVGGMGHRQKQNQADTILTDNDKNVQQ